MVAFSSNSVLRVGACRTATGQAIDGAPLPSVTLPAPVTRPITVNAPPLLPPRVDALALQRDAKHFSQSLQIEELNHASLSNNGSAGKIKGL